MANVLIEYNPIRFRSNIEIDGKELPNTADLYRYRNTPLDDWVDVLIPSLVDYCNDEEFTIKIHSMEKYVELIKEYIDKYTKEHRHIVVNEEVDLAPAYKGRLNKLNRIMDNMDDESINVEKPSMNLYIMAVNNEQEYDQFYDKHFSNLDEFNNPFFDLNIQRFPLLNDCENSYWKKIKDCVESVDPFLMIVILDSVPENNDTLIGYLEDELEKKGRINKSRFVFISSNPESNKKYLSSEYGIRGIMVYDLDNSANMLDVFNNYVEMRMYPHIITENENMLRRIADNYTEKDNELKKNLILNEETTKEIELVKSNYKMELDKIGEYYQGFEIEKSDKIDCEEVADQYIEKLSDGVTRELCVEIVSTINENNKPGSDSVVRSFVNILGRFETAEIKSKFDTQPIAERILFDEINDLVLKKWCIKSQKSIDSYDVKLKHNIVDLVGDELKSEIHTFMCDLARSKKRTENGSFPFFEYIIENTPSTALYDRPNGMYTADKPGAQTNIKRRIKTERATFVSIIKELMSRIYKSSTYQLDKVKEKWADMINTSYEEYTAFCDQLWEEEKAMIESEIDLSCSTSKYDEVLSELDEIINL